MAMLAGQKRHRVTLETPDVTTPDGDGGYTQTYVVLCRRIAACVQPATARSLEQLVASTLASTATHLVTIGYRTGVTTKTRVTYHDGATDRTLYVSGTCDPDEGHRDLVLACDEAVA